MKIKKELLLNIVTYLGILFTYVILDVGLRFFLWKKVMFVSYASFSPLAFSFSYGIILLSMMFLFSKKSKIIYIVSTIIFNIYFLAQMIYFKIFTAFISVVTLFSAGEATDYLDYTIKQIDNRMLVIVLLSFLSLEIVLIIKKMNNNNAFEVNNKKKYLLILVLLFIIFRVSGIYKLGKPVSNTAWNNWDTPRNIYNDFSNKSRSMMVSGMYEYMFRDMYLYIKNYVNPNKKEKIAEINRYIDSLDISKEDNEYSNIFKDKNLIMIMLESIDSWLVTDEVMPTMRYLQTTGLNFTNRYAPFYGGGMTINSEFAGITGLYSISNETAIYNYTDNNFNYSLPSLFIKNGYIVNSMHMNQAHFYNRKNFHKALGFMNHYSLHDLKIPGNISYDTNMVKQDDSYNLIVNKDKFVTFITTYSAHVPYIDSEMCDNLIKTNPSFKIDDEEITCIKLLAHETDDFLKLLLERLEEDNYLDNTVIVLYTDHYTYGFTRTEEMKNITDNNLIQNVPFVIWSKDIASKNINTIVDTADIVPTLFNMFGIDYDPKIYMGTDVFSRYHENFVYFSDYSWYDGNIYSKNAISSDYVNEISNKVNQKISINEKIVSSNYYAYYNK